MKNILNNFVLLSIFVFSSLGGIAQKNNDKSSLVEQQSKTENQNLLKEVPNFPKGTVVSKSVSSSTAKKPIRSNARVSDYLSLEKEIMLRSVTGKIPASLPKHIKGQTKEQYVTILKTWSKNHLSLIKKEYHAEISSKNILKK